MYFVVFFFQAEDGIRDWSVTGVQTCALPISAAGPPGASPGGVWAGWTTGGGSVWGARAGRGGLVRAAPQAAQKCACGRCSTRSEERRVGKECRSRWAARHDKEESPTVTGVTW